MASRASSRRSSATVASPIGDADGGVRDLAISALRRSPVQWSNPGFVVWFTGLSGAGKTTIATALAAELEQRGFIVDHLDGDAIRSHLSSELGFSPQDRDTNIGRIAWVSSRLIRAGAVVLVSAISPYEGSRRAARALIEPIGAFVEIHVATPLAECIRRDPKGLYLEALSGKRQGFTGVSAPYEIPSSPDLRLDTTGAAVEDSVKEVIACLVDRLRYESEAPR